MAGANYMGGKKNAAKVRSRDAAGRQQKRFFGRQRLNLLSKRRSINSPTSRNQPRPSISLAHAKQNPALSLSPRGYIPSPSKSWKSKRDGPSSASSSSKVLEALDTSEPISLRAAMNQILSLPDLAGLSTYKKRKRTLDASSPGARMPKRVKSELSLEKDEEELSSGSQNDGLCDSPDASFRDIYNAPDNDEYDDEEPDDAFFQAHLGCYTTSSSIQSFPVSAPSQRMPHIPIPNDVAQPTASFGTLAVTSSLQHSFSGNIFNYDDPWAAVGVILGLESAPSTPAKDVDNTSTLAEQPRPPSLARKARLTVYSSDQASSEGIPVASSHSSDNVPPPQVHEDDSYGQSDDFHFGEDESDDDHDLDDQDIHDVPAHVHRNSSPSLLHLESHLLSACFSSSNDYFNNLAGSPVADEEGKDPLFDCIALLDDSNSDCHSQPVINGEEDYADTEDADDYTFFETSSWAILDADQCVKEPIPGNHSSRFPSPDSFHRQDLITAEPSGVSPQYCPSPSVPAQISIHKDDLHVARYASSNASASSSPRSRAHRSPRTSHHSPTSAPLGLLNDAQLAALPITIKTNTSSSDSLARHAPIVQDPEPAIEPTPTPAPELTDETFCADKTIHSAHSPASIYCDESVEGIAPQAFTGFSLFSKDDFLEEPDSDD
ncbi:hypothetical protein IW262DRAFT_283266 [Armillaria fumosa]|nr:hypothetical protein IW262DRAFT_283266 [Armillaria fumosa]